MLYTSCIVALISLNLFSASLIFELSSEIALVTSSLSLEKNSRKLLEMIAREAKELTNADGCSLYIVSEDSKYLNFSIVMNDTLKIYHLA